MLVQFILESQDEKHRPSEDADLDIKIAKLDREDLGTGALRSRAERMCYTSGICPWAAETSDKSGQKQHDSSKYMI